MRHVTLFLAVCVAVFSFAATVAADPAYIYGMHEPGGEGDMSSMGTKGWILFTCGIGHNPSDYSGTDFTSYTNNGYGCIVRLNNGYGYDGTLPYQSQYQNFAQRCANFVNASPGAHIWIIGNEVNLACEWPGNNNGDPATGEPITVARYVDCYNRCYNAITALAGHSGDQIIPAPIGTYGPPLPAQGIDAFDDYFVNQLNNIGASKIGAIALHAYTHGTDPNLVFSEALMGSPYQDIHYNFRVYKDYMNRVPAGMTSKPVYLTETDQCQAWADTNSGWVKNVYSEINSWNSTHQKIRCVCLYRWPSADIFEINDKPNVRQDWRDAMAYGYTWTGGSTGVISGKVTDVFNVAINGATVSTNTGGYSANTDSNGNYTISNVTPGTYNVTASKSGFNSQTQNSKTVTGGQTTTVNFSLQSTTGMTPNTPTGTNLALSATQWPTDSNYSSSYDGSKAKDGTTSTKWCSASGAPPHWLAYDLGGDKTVNGFIVRHASTGGDMTSMNAKNFQIQSGNSISGPWTDEVVWNNSAQAAVTPCSYQTPKTLRYVRLYVTNTGIDNYCRLPEFEVYGVSGGMNGNTPTGTNLAPQSTQVSTDSNYSSSYDGWHAIDGQCTAGSKWCSAGTAPPHYLALDLGTNRTVNGFIVRYAGAAGELTSYNCKNFSFQSATAWGGPWSDECVVDNTAQASVVPRSYTTPKSLRYVRLYITNAGIDNYARVPEFEVWCAGAGGVSQDFESMPGWTSSYDATWGSAATWSIVGGGQSGNFLQASRSSQGSSSKALVYTVSTNTNYTISIYIKCPSYTGGNYWVETAYKLGSNTAQDFDQNSTTWTQIQKFADTGTNGNGNTWTQYTATVNSGSNTQISIGFKHGASGCTGPTVGWDTLRIN